MLRKSSAGSLKTGTLGGAAAFLGSACRSCRSCRSCGSCAGALPCSARGGRALTAVSRFTFDANLSEASGLMFSCCSLSRRIERATACAGFVAAGPGHALAGPVGLARGRFLPGRGLGGGSSPLPRPFSPLHLGFARSELLRLRARSELLRKSSLGFTSGRAQACTGVKSELPSTGRPELRSVQALPLMLGAFPMRDEDDIALPVKHRTLGEMIFSNIMMRSATLMGVNSLRSGLACGGACRRSGSGLGRVLGRCFFSGESGGAAKSASD
mmetsp:Transcript_4131/g.9952  ORF Transcript_4131/g.9952 Transcript_4131/m.9952 type:complete len:270 (+) Transcript_4131:453-1262(+)